MMWAGAFFGLFLWYKLFATVDWNTHRKAVRPAPARFRRLGGGRASTRLRARSLHQAAALPVPPPPPHPRGMLPPPTQRHPLPRASCFVLSCPTRRPRASCPSRPAPPSATACSAPRRWSPSSAPTEPDWPGRHPQLRKERAELALLVLGTRCRYGAGSGDPDWRQSSPTARESVCVTVKPFSPREPNPVHLTRCCGKNRRAVAPQEPAVASGSTRERVARVSLARPARAAAVAVSRTPRAGECIPVGLRRRQAWHLPQSACSSHLCADRCFFASHDDQRAKDNSTRSGIRSFQHDHH